MTRRPAPLAPHRSRPVRLALGVVLVAVALTSCEAAEPTRARYVALGDSYAAGPGIPATVGDVPSCGRSSANYASIVATAIQAASFDDASCSGARFAQLTAPQWTSDGTNPAQLDRLSADTDLVTMTLGGNDLPIALYYLTCAESGVRAAGVGDPCFQLFSRHLDELRARLDQVAALLDEALVAIAERAPHARVLVVGYPAVLPEDGSSCYPRVPIAAGDAPRLRDLVKLANAVEARVVARHRNAAFVDTYAASIGHDACQPPGVRWIEPISEVSQPGDLHPNAAGMAATAMAVLAEIEARPPAA